LLSRRAIVACNDDANRNSETINMAVRVASPVTTFHPFDTCLGLISKRRVGDNDSV
jgi:hypothetical protein